MPHDGPRYPYDGAGDSDKALAGAGRGNLHIRQQAHSTPHTSNHMQHGQGPAQDPAFTFLLTCIKSWTKLADIRDSTVCLGMFLRLGTKAGNGQDIVGVLQKCSPRVVVS